MKQFILLFILCEFAIVDIYTIDLSKKSISIEEINQNLRKLNVSDTATSLYDETSDIETNIIETTPTSNATLDTTPTTIPTTTPIPEYIFLYLLLGFGDYRYFRYNNYIFFYIYFRRYSGIRITYLTITVIVHYSLYFRNLEEEIIKEMDITCPVKTQLNNVFQLNCTFPVENRQVNRVEVKNNTFIFDGEHQKPIYSPIGNKTMLNVTKVQGYDEFEKFIDKDRHIQLFSLDNSTKEIYYSEHKFRVLNGIRKRQNIENDTEVIRGTQDNSLNGEYIFPFEDEKTFEIKKVPCTITYIDSVVQFGLDFEVYEAECYPSGNLTTFINQAIGYDSTGKNNDTFVMFNVSDDYVDLGYYDTGIARKYVKKSYSRLSGGAIAGICVVCLVTLVLIALLILFIRRRKKEENEMNNDSTASALNTMNNITV